MALALRSLAGGSTGESPGVNPSRIERAFAGRKREALVYYPRDHSPSSALLLIAGISEKGCYHPRLMALSRSLADLGFLVVTPDITSFRRFSVPPGSMDEIAAWFEEIHGLEGASSLKRVGMAGISFSGTLALMVSARDEIRDRVAYVLAVGPYYDLSRCAGIWFAKGSRTVSEGYYPTRYYGRWILMLSALEMLDDEADRKALDGALRSLLLRGKVSEEPGALSAEGRRWLAFARMREDETDLELVQSIQSRLAPYFATLSPDEAAARVRCPVFLAHGAHDDLIPSEESRALKAKIAGPPVHLMISPFLTHTHPLDRELGAYEKIAAATSMLGFFYRLSEAAR
jgi:pimeloyl-ACP methyl ester carboxylesterase